MKNDSILQLKNISVHYGGVHALDGVDFEINPREIISVMGPNGAGKSTVLKAIFGLAPIVSGDVVLHDKKIKPISYEMVASGVTLVPQGKRVFSDLTVEENIEIGGLLIKDKEELKRRMEEMWNMFPALKPKKKQRAGKLSGGQQQMVALARGLMTYPQILLLDEPSLGLAPKIVKEIFEKINEIKETRNISVVIVEHNIKSAINISDRAYILDKGKVVAEGDAKEIEKSDILEKVFMGKI